MDPHERARKLVALATDASASPEEARTAAMAACRHIVKHKLLEPSAEHGHAGDAHARAPRRRSGGSRSPSHENGHGARARPETPADAGVNYRAARAGTCAFCAKPFGPTDEVMTHAVGAFDHWHCAKRRAAGAEPGT